MYFKVSDDDGNIERGIAIVERCNDDKSDYDEFVGYSCWIEVFDSKTEKDDEGSYSVEDEFNFPLTPAGRAAGWQKYDELCRKADFKGLAKCVMFMEYAEAGTGYPVREFWGNLWSDDDDE